ncbi:MAG: phosphatase PAP2 family protein [Hyphomicrobium sp.]
MFRKAKGFAAAIVIGCVAGSLSALAEDMNCPTTAADPRFALLSPPPCDNCAETKLELDELRTLQRNRSEAESKHAVADNEISLARFIDGAGLHFDAAALAKCKPFFDKLGEKTKDVIDHAKPFFCRIRPYNQLNSDLKPLLVVKNSPAYPSGHTTYGTAVGAVLAQMVPEKRAEFYARSADYAHSRMVVGVHYRSDIEAGKTLGMTVVAEAFANDNDFRATFPEATKCIREALGLPQAVGAPIETAAPAAKP